MQSTTTASMLYGKCHATGVAYSSEPGVRVTCDNIETASANTVSEIKTIFFTPEGVYRQMTISEYIRPNRAALNQTQNTCPISNTLVRVSFLKVPLKTAHSGGDAVVVVGNGEQGEVCTATDYIERICFNVGREIYVYDYGGLHGSSDLSKPIDKRVYKGTFPTCHDFNQETASLESSTLIIGFTAGQIQLFDPYRKDSQSKLYNEDRIIDKSPVTHVKWIPGQASMFIASHASGNLYVYNEEYAWTPNPPVYQLLRQGDGFTVHASKSKSARNPVHKWTIGDGAAAVNQFEFSADPDAKFLATAGQDGFLRVFNYKSMELMGYIRSYFGGLLCLAWSPDTRLIATGGEDDMLTIYSMAERRVLCRGQGHKSWVAQVAFDAVASVCTNAPPTAFPAASLAAAAAALPPHATIQKIPEESGSELQNEVQGLSIKTAFHNGKGAAKRNAKISPNSEADQFCASNLDAPGGGNSTRNGEPKPSSSLEFTDASNCSDSPLTRAQKDSLSSNSLSRMAAGGGRGAAGRGLVNGDQNHHLATSSTLPSSSSALLGATPQQRQHQRAATAAAPATTTSRSCYRIGSVGYDTQLCLWDLSDDILNCDSGGFRENCDATTVSCAGPAADQGLGPSTSATMVRGKPGENRTVISIGMSKTLGRGEISLAGQSKAQSPTDSVDSNSVISQPPGRGESKSKFRKLHKRGLSFGSRLNDRWSRSNGNSTSLNGFAAAGAHSTAATANSVGGGGAKGDISPGGGGGGAMSSSSGRIFGTAQCPRMDDVPVIEPLVCKKIAHERLTVLHFRDECLVTACQEGLVLTWARPGKIQSISPIHHANHSYGGKTRYYSTGSANAAADSDGTCI